MPRVPHGLSRYHHFRRILRGRGDIGTLPAIRLASLEGGNGGSPQRLEAFKNMGGVDGWTNPSEKYLRQILNKFP